MMIPDIEPVKNIGEILDELKEIPIISGSQEMQEIELSDGECISFRQAQPISKTTFTRYNDVHMTRPSTKGISRLHNNSGSSSPEANSPFGTKKRGVVGSRINHIRSKYNST